MQFPRTWKVLEKEDFQYGYGRVIIYLDIFLFGKL